MRSNHRQTLLTVVVTAAVLVGGANLAAYAANGDPLLLGKGNVGSKTTKLKTTGTGAALRLKSKAGSPSLAVSNTAKVTRLNADLVDGLEGESLATRTTVYTNPGGPTVYNGTLRYVLTVPAGSHLLSFSAGLLPSANGAATLCGFSTIGPGARNFGLESGTYNNLYGGVWMSGSAVLDFGVPSLVRFFCNTTAPSFTVEDEQGIQVEVTKLTGSTAGTMPAPTVGKHGS